MINPVEPFVISVCSIHAGTKDNVIPDDAILLGTIRTMNDKTRKLAKKSVVQITKAICEAFNAKYELEFKEDAYPVTYNDEKTTERVSEILKTIEGDENKRDRRETRSRRFFSLFAKSPWDFLLPGNKK